MVFEFEVYFLIVRSSSMRIRPRIDGFVRLLALSMITCLVVGSAEVGYGQVGRKPSGPAGKSKATGITARPGVPDLDSDLRDAIKNAPASGKWPNSNFASLLDLA